MVDFRKLTPRQRLRSFGHAVEGITYFVWTQPNVIIMAAATAVVIAAGCWFKVTLGEWGLLAVAVFIVWITEALNTAIEAVVDLASPSRHPLAKRAKDTAAGAVLLASLLALVLALLIFVPRFAALLR